jgi:acetyl esterase/lipase
MLSHTSVGVSNVLRLGVATCALMLALSPLRLAAAAEPQAVPLWPNGAPLATGTAAADQPFLEVYPAADDAAGGPAFVICPGGGYGALAADHEGTQIARWANGIGATAFVLHYRLGSKGYHYPVQLIDVQRALRFVRANAARYKVDPQRIGIIGFSAGGHLASMAATLFDERPAGTTDDEVDAVSARPDVAVLGYPVISMTAAHAHRGSRKNLLGPAADDDDAARRLDTDTRVTTATPPTFLFQTDEDTGVPAENAISFYLACRRERVPAELHVFERGPHGVGFALGDPVLSTWPDRLAAWLRDRGFLTVASRVPVKGRVTIDGQPVSWGMISFVPENPRAAVATARIRNGDFKLDEKLGPVAAPVRVTVTYSAADTPGVPGTNGVVTTTKPRPDAEPWRLDFSGAIAPEPLTIDIVR